MRAMVLSTSFIVASRSARVACRRPYPATRAATPAWSAVRRSGLAASLGHDDEPDLALPNHPEALTRDPLEVGRVVQVLDLPLELRVLLLEDLLLVLEDAKAITLGHVRPQRHHQVE